MLKTMTKFALPNWHSFILRQEFSILFSSVTRGCLINDRQAFTHPRTYGWVLVLSRWS